MNHRYACLLYYAIIYLYGRMSNVRTQVNLSTYVIRRKIKMYVCMANILEIIKAKIQEPRHTGENKWIWAEDYIAKRLKKNWRKEMNLLDSREKFCWDFTMRYIYTANVKRKWRKNYKEKEMLKNGHRPTYPNVDANFSVRTT